MAKFKVLLKLQGLELEIEGSREDVPIIAESLQKQIGGLLNPAGSIIEGEITQQPLVESSTPSDQAPKRKGKRRSNRASSTAKGNQTDAAIDFKHDYNSFGSPQQSWNTAKKSMWLLYVVDKQLSTNELTAVQIASTFNKHFKQSGALRAHNVSRDLGKLKTQQGAPFVGEGTNSDPSTWYLTDSGLREAEKFALESRETKTE